MEPENVPVVTTECASIRVLAGDFCGVRAIQPLCRRKIIFAYVQLDPGGRENFAIPPGMRGTLFVIEGRLGVDDATVKAGQMMIPGEEDVVLATTNLNSGRTTRFIIAAGEPVNRPFHKLLGLGGFIIGDDEDALRSAMAELADTAERIKQEVPEQFPAQYR